VITIVDYGMGNLCSVAKALESLGQEVEVVDAAERVEEAERLILPGVGAFGDAMAELERRGLCEPIRRFAAAGRPLLGICLGMQLFMDNSEEAPGVAGLGLIPGSVRRFQTRLKVPHMGWNTVRQARPAPLFRDLPDDQYFYFVHSYYVAPDRAEVAAGLTDYAVEFPSVIWRENVVATQFHPEKSQQRGLAMLRNFCRM
jgi:imidazole glycerol phosphate synthase glutamine amidotransferase subunit